MENTLALRRCLEEHLKINLHKHSIHDTIYVINWLFFKHKHNVNAKFNLKIVSYTTRSHS